MKTLFHNVAPRFVFCVELIFLAFLLLAGAGCEVNGGRERITLFSTSPKETNKPGLEGGVEVDFFF